MGINRPLPIWQCSLLFYSWTLFNFLWKILIHCCVISTHSRTLSFYPSTPTIRLRVIDVAHIASRTLQKFRFRNRPFTACMQFSISLANLIDKGLHFHKCIDKTKGRTNNRASVNLIDQLCDWYFVCSVHIFVLHHYWTSIVQRKMLSSIVICMMTFLLVTPKWLYAFFISLPSFHECRNKTILPKPKQW